MAKPIDYIERLFYFNGAPSVEYKASIGNVRNLTRLGNIDEVTKTSRTNEPAYVNGIGLHIPQLFYDVEIDGALITRLQKAGQGDFLTGLTDPFSLENDGLEIATVRAQNGGLPGEPRGVLRVHVSRFPALDYFDVDGDHDTDRHSNTDGPIESVPLSPLLPGRYAVVGTAGEVFGKSTNDYDAQTTRTYDNLEDRYTSIISRSLSSTDPNRDPADLEFLNTPEGFKSEQTGFRRIEMIPSADPNRAQFIVRMNGGLINGSRISEVVNIGGSSGSVNITDPVQYADEEPGGGSKQFTPVVKPIVGIPMQGFTISEPLDGYLLRQMELDPQLNLFYYKDPRFPNTSERPAQGAYVNGDRDLSGYDEPFDLLPELIENQTTPNYRTMHLQRLANPRLAWNPPPVSATGRVNPQHDPTRPVNPYLTIDSLSLDLTSLNSTSAAENQLTSSPGDAKGTGPEMRHQLARNQLPNDTSGNRGTNHPFTRVTLESQERGLHTKRAGTGEDLPRRTLWGQDRAMGVSEVMLDRSLQSRLKIHSEVGGLNAKNNRYSFGTDETYGGSYKEAVFRLSACAIVLVLLTENLDVSITTSTMLKWPSLRITLDIDGDTDLSEYDLVGVPAIDDSDSSTTPVFHWPNRPFISEGEIIQVPIWSSSRMLTYYSVFNAALNG